MPSVIDSTNRTRLNQQFALLLDLISEGEIEGLVNGHGSVYLNETPIAPPSKSATVSYKTGTVTTNGTTTVQASSDLFAGIDLSEGARYIQIRSAAGASTLNSIHYINDTTITVAGATFAGSQELNTFNAVFGTQAEFKNIRIPGAGPDGTEYVGSIIEVVDSTTAIVSPPLSTQVASGTAVEVDYFAQITGITDNDTCTVATGGMRSITSTALISPARATRTTYNFRNTSAAFRAGTLHQSIPSFSTAAPSASFIASGPASDLQWSSAHGGTAAPVTINGSTYLSLTAAQKQEIDQVVLTLEFPAGLLYVQKDGGQHSATAEFRVVLRYKKSASATSWTETTLIGPTNPAAWPSEGFRRDDPNRNTNGSIRGRTNGSFLQEFKINLQQFQPLYDWELDLYRTTPDNPDDYNNNFVTDTVVLTTRLRTIQANIFDKFSYPNSAYAAVTFNAEDFSNIPTRGYHIRGKKVRVPTNYITREEIDSSNPLAQEAKYTRNVSTGIDTNTYQYWNGAFRGDSSLSDTNVNFRKVYTNNPAWIFYDILTNKNYGLGEYIEESDIDVFSLYEIARYCDEMVPDGKGGTEPRFTCNVYFQTKQEAYKVLKDLASTFRGMMYWIDGQITTVQDRPKEPVYTFTQGNVIDGLFSYESTGQRARVNQVNVTWNDPDQFYKQDVTTVDDIDDIAKSGKIMSKDVVAFGCTSEGQATRVGRWHLLTSQFENEIVKFETSINAGFLRPGDLIKIQDAKADSVEFSGRLSTGSTTTSLNLDRSVVLQAGESYNLYLIYPEAGTYLEQASATINSTNYVRGDLILLDNSGNPIVDREDAVNLYDENTNEKVQIAFSPNSRLEVKPISTTAGTVSTLAVSSAFSSAPNSEVIWAVSNVNEYQRADAAVTYRILGISEDDINKYSIVASKYAPQKYDELEKQWAVYVPPYVPTPSRDVDVPSVTGLRIEVVPAIGARDGSNSGALDAIVSWNEPTEIFTDSNGNSETTRYRFIDFYEVQHNFYSSKSGADAGTVNVIPASRTSEVYSNVGAGEYTVRVRVRNISGHFSPWTEVTQTVSATQQPGLSYDRTLKVVRGGSINSPLSFDAGVLTVDNSNYTFVSTVGQAYAVTSATTPQSTVDFSGVSSGDTTYWLFDYSDTSDPWKIVAVHTDNTVQSTAGVAINFSYWKEYGASNNGLSLISGTISAVAGTNIVSGSGTSFTTDYEVGDLIKLSPVNNYSEVAGAQYLEVLSIDSDTSLSTRTNIVKDFTSDYAYKQSFKIDFLNDNILAEVTNSGGTFSIEYYVLKSGTIGVDGATGARTASGFLYYQLSSTSAPSAPSASGYSYSTGQFSSLTANWDENAPTFVAGNANKYWYVRFTVEEDEFEGSQTVSIGSVLQGIGFTGLVTFTSSNILSDGSSTYDPALGINTGVTTINGGKITTGSITADKIQTNSISTTQLTVGVTDSLDLADTAQQNNSAKTAGSVGGWTVDSSAIYSGTKDVSGYTSGGITISSAGGIHTPYFYSESGAAGFRGTLTIGSTNLTATNTLNENTTKADVDLGNVENENPSGQLQRSFALTTTISSGNITVGNIVIDGANGRIVISD